MEKEVLDYTDKPVQVDLQLFDVLDVKVVELKLGDTNLFNGLIENIGICDGECRWLIKDQDVQYVVKP